MKLTQLTSINPATNEKLWSGTVADAVSINRAVEASIDAQKRWEDTPLETRKQIIRSFSEQVAACGEEVARIISEDSSKPL